MLHGPLVEDLGIYVDWKYCIDTSAYNKIYMLHETRLQSQQTLIAKNVVKSFTIFFAISFLIMRSKEPGKSIYLRIAHCLQSNWIMLLLLPPVVTVSRYHVLVLKKKR